MQLHPRVTRRTVEFVRKFEGFREEAAPVEGGWTLGYGHTATARSGAKVSHADADMLLAYDLTRVAEAIEPLIYAPLDANAFDALVSFAFSVGVEAFRRSEVRRRLNKGATLQAAAALELWRRAELQGELQVVDALVRRRAVEKALFLTPAAGFPGAPSPVVRSRLDSTLLAAATRLAGLDAETAAVIAQPPATEIAAPLDGSHVAARRIGREPDARGQTGLRAEVVDALAARLDRVLDAERAASATSGDEPTPPPPPAITHVDRVRDVPSSSADTNSAHEPKLPPILTRSQVEAAPRVAGVLARLRRSSVYLAIFLLGLGLFLVAAVCIVDRPTVGFLVLGLLGVLAMAPAAFQALLRRRR